MPGTVLGSAGSRDQAGRKESPADQEGDDAGEELLLLVLAGEDERKGAHAGCERHGADCEPDPRRRADSRRAESLAADSSALGTKPRAPDWATRDPKSERSRLEVSTMAGDHPFRVSCSATAKPSMSGSWTSSRRTSGRSLSAASMPAAPSWASPTTSKPSDSSSARAVRRKLGWSSTIRTVLGMHTWWHAHRPRGVRLSTLFQGYPPHGPPSTSGPGHGPFKAVARVRIPLGA